MNKTQSIAITCTLLMTVIGFYSYNARNEYFSVIPNPPQNSSTSLPSAPQKLTPMPLWGFFIKFNHTN